MELKDAYSFKALGDKLKDQGLELAEDAVESIYIALKAWLKDSAAKSSTPIDDVVVGFLDQLDPVVMPEIDKINPADNA